MLTPLYKGACNLYLAFILNIKEGDLMNFMNILDANINRVAEGLRVLEDYFRFFKKNKEFALFFKTKRQSLRNFFADLNKEPILNRGQDFGQNNYEQAEKFSDRDLVIANFKRIEEGLRTVEESLKISQVVNKSARISLISKLRFEIYLKERNVFEYLFKPLPEGIYAITAEKYSNNRSNIEIVKEMVKGGVSIIQYREKAHLKSFKSMLEECKEIRKITKDNGVLFIVNDYLALALLAEADGIHLGQDDISISEIRKISQDLMIGLSTHSPDQAKKALSLGVNYIGVGPIFKTSTKENVCAPVGLEYLEFVAQNIDLPFVAIGGIKENNIKEVVTRGAKIVSLVTEIVAADDVVAKTKKLVNLLKDYKN